MFSDDPLQKTSRLDDRRVGKNKRGLIVSFVAEVVTGAAIGAERTTRAGIVAGFGFICAGFCTVVSENFTAKHTLKLIKRACTIKLTSQAVVWQSFMQMNASSSNASLQSS